MSESVSSFHHITAIASDPQANLDFYAGLLGLRLVKRTVNFDDPGSYHLYYGDRTGRPGTILTFFPWPGARRGSRGPGQATVIALSVPPGALEFWKRRLGSAGVATGPVSRRFGEEFLSLRDPDGMCLELASTPGSSGEGYWEEGPVPAEFAISGLRGATLVLAEPAPTAELLTEMGFREMGREDARERWLGGSKEEGCFLQLAQEDSAGWGRMGAGSVHHLAWRVSDRTAQSAWREDLLKRGFHVSPQMDRVYFRSIYFREPGGVLFELATDGPGFLVDEAEEVLGQELRLPPWLEGQRGRLQGDLPQLRSPGAQRGEARR